MKDSQELRERAKRLMECHPYFYWQHIEALAAWCRYNLCCVYCEEDLKKDWETLRGLAHTDHLLPGKPEYDQLRWDDSNLVPCCSICNSIKGGFDANSKT
jgi:5-methylcytosine-specific restriction endonuclease McrA